MKINIFKVYRIQKHLTFILFIVLILLFFYIFKIHYYTNENVASSLKSVFEEKNFKFSSDESKFLKTVQRNRYNISCDAVLHGNKAEINKAYKILKEISPINDKNYAFSPNMCNTYRNVRGYDDHPISDEELNFPLGFTILTYENVEQFERLLRVIYRKHNLYCIHVDAKSSKEFHESIKSIVRCFDNVFITKKLEKIVYAGISRLQADLNCMNELLERRINVKWKYLFNLASTEFPLKTNYELVKILKLYNGANDIEVMKNFDKNRILYKWIKNDEGVMVRTQTLNDPPPHKFEIMKGLAYGAFSYKFIEYALKDNKSIDFFEWLKDIYSPDEIFWSTLQYNTQFNVPGGYKDEWKERNRINTTARWIIWFEDVYFCFGSVYHSICQYELRDLPFLITRREFFVNKFKLNENGILYQCMEDWIKNKEISNPYIRINDYCYNPIVQKYNNDYYCDYKNYLTSLTVP